MALALARANGLRATGRNPSPFDAELIEYYADLLGQFGHTLDLAQLASGRSIGYPELASAVVADLGIDEPDLILLAYAIPDLHPLKTVATYVNHLFGDQACSMALSEQGLQAPYTALRMADAYQCDQALILVLEQTTLPYRDPLVHDTPLSDTAVALVFERADGDFQRPWSGTPAELTAMIDQCSDTLVVAGPWVCTDRGFDLHRCGPGTYCTSVWLALAENYQRWQGEYRHVLLCDVDPRTGDAHAVRVDLR
ncbi:hypothetical protein LWC34_10280 [Kibdelosporangium philippinense]|uniref:Uncharacterized protein n=1 Tax=Kibdelosporangium philippinense TaxID=211113 RepID=A0ABS8Z5Y0_9PSEU|nr:hypothetical protein [Kibdelosporangium philippinense]MCE7003215.1 hypothetical protein [Kibdelosporangium philippinense]